jgi:hypothetical protein
MTLLILEAPPLAALDPTNVSGVSPLDDGACRPAEQDGDEMRESSTCEAEIPPAGLEGTLMAQECWPAPARLESLRRRTSDASDEAIERPRRAAA